VLAYIIPFPAAVLLAIVLQQTLPLKASSVSLRQWHGKESYGVPAARVAPSYSTQRTDTPGVRTELF